MAHPVEPMDIDNIDSDFDNKENTFHHSNVQPCTEKGYEELDVSELNMRLRYSVTPAGSPMSKSYTSYVDNRSLDSEDSLNITVNNNLTRSLNSTITKNDSVVKSLKSFPLQSLPTDQSVERNVSVLRQLDSTITSGNNNVTVIVSSTNNIDENISLPSSSSSAIPTPEATTPTKDIPKNDGGSPIMRGLKSVLNMFRSSQSPIPPPENEVSTPKQLTPTLPKRLSSEPRDKAETKPVLASTPISTHRDRDANGSKRSSPLKDSITFNDDLEKELQWKDETTILFSQEKIPIHKLFYQQKQNKVDSKASEIKTEDNDNLDTTVEYMDISYNDSVIKDRTLTKAEQGITKNEFHVGNESDSEFLDCETESNATKTESYIMDNKEEEFYTEESLTVQKPVKNVTLHEHDQELPQFIDETKKLHSNVTVPIATINDELLENKLFTSFYKKENVDISNESTINNSLNKIENDLQIPKEIDNVTQQITELTPTIHKSEPNPELILDVTMSMDDQDNKNKSIKNVLEVSTLESHTKSLSSLIESLDVTKSFDEGKVNNEANYIRTTTPTFNPDTVDLEANNLEVISIEKPAQTPYSISNSTTTINNQENETSQAKNLSQLTLNLPEHLTSSTLQNITTKLDKQVNSISESTLDSLENKEDINVSNETDKEKVLDKVFAVEPATNVDDNTFNISNETAKDVLPLTIAAIQSIQEITTHEASQEIDQVLALEPTTITTNVTNESFKDHLVISNSAIQSVQESTTQKASQVTDKVIDMERILIIESPADAPLPDDDDDVVKDVNIATDIDVFVTNDAPSRVDGSTTETEGKMIIKSVSENNTNDRQLSDILLETKNFEKGNEITSPVQTASAKEDVTDSTNSSLEVGNILSSLEENQDITAIDEVNNIDTFDVQTTTGNPSISKTQILPDVVNQSLNESEIGGLCASNLHTVENVANEVNNEESNIPANHENQLLQSNLQSNNDQRKIVHDDFIQSDIRSEILPENQMETSTSTCEEILDKNREISEVFLTEQKIDKLQHASDVASSCQDIKDDYLPVCHVQNEVITNIMNITFKEDEKKATNPPEADTSITSLKTQDFNNADTIEEHVNISNVELKDIPEQEVINTEEIRNIEIIKLVENETADSNATIDEEAKLNALGKGNADQEMVHKEGNNIVKADKIYELSVNNTTTISDVKIGKDELKDIATEKEKNIEQDKGDRNETLPLNLNDGFPETSEIAVIDDEIIMSGNNSPYVSVAADLDKVFEEKPLESVLEIENSFTTRNNIPSSPPIASKGYNFNFDDMDDPFATKVKIRMSPTPESPNKVSEFKKEDKTLPKVEPFKKDINKNRRRSQPARQKLSNTKKAFNATFDGSVSVPETNNSQIKIDTQTESKKKTAVEAKQITPVYSSNDIIASTTISSEVDKKDPEKVPEINSIDVIDADTTINKTLTEEIPKVVTVSEENKDSIESVTATTNEIKTTSSSEQSTYYSAGTSSSESMKSKNVFNLPEIDDMNFNPFASKSKMRQSPPRGVDMDNPFATKDKVMNSPNSSMWRDNGEKGANTTINIVNNCTERHLEDKMDTEPMEKDSSANMSNTSNSSKVTDKDVTIKEVNTEDEDTVEGPFLEAEDIEENQSEFDGGNVDMMQFHDLPVPEHDENADGELFIDAEAFEFLLNQNKSNVVTDSGKESLFLKFDPLFAKRMSSDSVVAALSRAQKRQSTPIRTSRQQKNLPPSVAGPSTMNLTYEADANTTEATEDVNTTVSKPMMVVTPAVNPTATLRKSVTPTRSNRRSITFTSPAMAVIDRLLSLSANNSFAEQETVPQVSREQTEAELALTQLREVLAEKEIHVYNLRSESKELKDRLTTLESQMKLLENEGQERLKKINDLNEKLSEKTKMNKSMAVVVEEYERTIASLIAETEQDKKRHAEERIALMNERDEQTAHLASMEVSFNDLHSKYEKSKQVIMNYKANEESYKQSLKEFEENVSKMQKNYELLKQHATSKLNHANDELQKINRSHESEVLKLNAMIKRKELHITSLEETLAQKTKANEELTAICDELINKVG